MGKWAKAKQLTKLGISYVRPQWQLFWKYARVELRPPTPLEIPQIIRDVGGVVKGAVYLHRMTVREAWLNALVATEIGCWFYVGECIGKRHIVGYVV